MARRRPSPRTPRWLPPLLVVALAFAVSFGSHVRMHATHGDPWGCLLTSRALLEHHTVRLDAYPNSTRSYQFFTRNGHRYYYFPLGTPLLAAPYVWLREASGLDVTVPADDAKVQRELALATTALTAWLVFLLCRMFLSPWGSALTSLIFVLGSPLMSTMAMAMWSVNFEVIFALSALLLLVRAERRPTAPLRPVMLGSLLFGAYLCRPTAAPLVAGTVIFVALRRRHELAALLATLVVPSLALVWFSWREWGQLLPEYYLPTNRAHPPDMLLALYGCLLSPSRGLLVFCPFLVLPLGVALLRPGSCTRSPFYWLTLAWFAAHLAVLSSYYLWWGGWSYGPRLFIDVIPALLLLTLLVWHGTRARLTRTARAVALALFTTLGATGVFIHSYQGLYNESTLAWNAEPNIDMYPEYLFDWKYPLFLATPQMLARRNAEHHARRLTPTTP